jgi:hypothetical protein
MSSKKTSAKGQRGAAGNQKRPAKPDNKSREARSESGGAPEAQLRSVPGKEWDPSLNDMVPPEQRPDANYPGTPGEDYNGLGRSGGRSAPPTGPARPSGRGGV